MKQPAPPAMIPFADDSASCTLGGITIENGTDSIAFYGQANLTRDRAGLRTAQDLLAFLQSVVNCLASTPDLPAAIKPPSHKGGKVDNPFM
ncbi:hypothetical protein IFJ82_15010 [Novacetimonas hansenii]|uniref:Uncharacterized protein n=2 Tax=Novacetimonas hansenii TaxID=436 RepID=A0AAW5ESD3_NOVHA|nr:hypothetical protein [Novacetimonas hansenii]EFG85668.1 hypothetical protein GXY_02381 [Novacetimonas hansenii ATCC 23769]MBL7238227.1 hypothetical protein [Novacetimonas hansenii]MCJ8353449.1 hypothetical protein [Novacetimonas hansenii]PYD72306.1 hypothetical protein CFR74_10060 [Novacetimonas hansenii]QOF95085.1 hypothetical protein IFJ82_15010 [Novacetimonas hansenii]